MRVKRQTVSKDSTFESLLFHSFLYNFKQWNLFTRLSKIFTPQYRSNVNMPHGLRVLNAELGGLCSSVKLSDCAVFYSLMYILQI